LLGKLFTGCNTGGGPIFNGPAGLDRRPEFAVAAFFCPSGLQICRRQYLLLYQICRSNHKLRFENLGFEKLDVV